MSDVDLHVRASALFTELRELSASEQTDALAKVAASDGRLADEVASLLAHDVDDAPIAQTSAASPERVTAYGEPALPARLGPYRVISRIGRGGSGQVFLAEQDSPVRRRVAIKVVPQAAVSAEMAARFEVERRALECTDHPNITRVLDAGRTPDGLPYLVMNLVEGEPITEHCARRAMRTADRVRLMLDVADAVQHAHQRGVIHRDLKPANILVAEVDGRSVPQVLDFGIAKPVAGIMASESPPTLGLPMGTPAYMAPEQTGVGTVDTRADVYALGAVLYELVAGRPPLEVAGDPLAALRRVREAVPPPASRVRSEQPSRGAPGHVPRSFLADLDVILAKALEKRPDRRYASVDALSDDLRRLLACEPIAARRPTLGYRAVRFAQRNRALVASAAVVAVALCVGIVGLRTGLVEAQEQSKRALDEGDAQREINRFLTEDLLAASSPDREGKSVTVLELLDRASQRIGERFPDRPLIAAAIHHTLGEAYSELGAFDQAEGHLERAVTLRRAAAGADAPDTVRSEISAVSLLARRERMLEAEAAYLPIIARARLILGPDDPALYNALNDLGVALATLDRNDEAIAVLEEALAGRRRLLGANGPLVVTTLGNLAYARDAKGDSAAALELMREALRLVEAAPEKPRGIQLGLNNNIGATLQDLDRNEEAAPYLARAAELAAEVHGPDHPDTLSIQANLAGLWADLGESERAILTFRHVVERRTALLGATAASTLTARYGHWNAMWKARRFDEASTGFAELLVDVNAGLSEDHWLSAQTSMSLARALLDAGRADEALPHAERAQARLLALYDADHPRTRTAAQVLDDIRGRLGAAGSKSAVEVAGDR